MGFVGGGAGEGSGNGLGAGSGSGPGSGSGGCGSEFMDRLECTIYTVHGLGSYSRRIPLVHRFNKCDKSPIRSSFASAVALCIVAAVAILFFLRAAKTLLIPIALAVLIRYALAPVMFWLSATVYHDWPVQVLCCF